MFLIVEISMKYLIVFGLAAALTAGGASASFAQATTSTPQDTLCPPASASGATGNTATGTGPGSAANGATEGEGTGAAASNSSGGATANNCPTTVVPSGSPNTGGHNNSAAPSNKSGNNGGQSNGS